MSSGLIEPARGMTYIVIAGVVLAAAFMLSGGSRGRARVGRVVEDLEARLKPVRQEGPTWMASGKVHRERYADGREEFDLRCAGLRANTGEPSLPAKAALDVVVGEEVIATVTLASGHVRLQLRSANGQHVPPVTPGTPVSLRYQDHVLLAGVFQGD